MRFAWALVPLFGALFAAACGDASGPDPFGGAGGTSGVSGSAGQAGAPDGAGGEDAGANDPTLGGPCLDDGQCDDTFDCTLDRCDTELERCRHEPDDSLCDDGLYCNGSETCDVTLGCRPASAPTCSDADTCTIDTCIEASQSCRHEPRDADGDGDPARACGGADCRDDDPLISSHAHERCGNQTDDDCDGSVDESDCVAPAHDRCADALVVESAGSYVLSLVGAGVDYSFSCAPEGQAAALRDLVVAIVVPDGDAWDVDVVATVSAGSLALSASERCGNASGETACAAGVELPDGSQVARLLLRGREPGPLAVLVGGTAETEVSLRVTFRDPEPVPEHETCGTAQRLEPGVVESATLAGIDRDLATACPSETGELVYFFDLASTRDVRLRAVALDDFGVPVISLRAEHCIAQKDELTCRAASPSELFARALAPGRYYVMLAGTGPCDAELVLESDPPSVAPADQGCDAPPELEPGVTEQVSLADHEDAVRIGCLVGAPDAARSLELSERSDVLLVQTGSDGDQGAALWADAPCAGMGDRLACESWEDWPIRSVARGVGPGSVRAVVETAGGTPTTLTVFERPARESVLVHRADECADAFEIPETGGRFEGNTLNAYADYEGSCDYGGQPAGGAPEQMLRLTLTTPRRVVLDLRGSEFDTLLVVRRGPDCPGPEVPGACAPGYVAERSFLDTELSAGTYWIQIDGDNGAAGRWFLDVFSAER